MNKQQAEAINQSSLNKNTLYIINGTNKAVNQFTKFHQIPICSQSAFCG